MLLFQVVATTPDNKVQAAELLKSNGWEGLAKLFNSQLAEAAKGKSASSIGTFFFGVYLKMEDKSGDIADFVRKTAMNLKADNADAKKVLTDGIEEINARIKAKKQPPVSGFVEKKIVKLDTRTLSKPRQDDAHEQSERMREARGYVSNLAKASEVLSRFLRLDEPGQFARHGQAAQAALEGIAGCLDLLGDSDLRLIKKSLYALDELGIIDAGALRRITDDKDFGKTLQEKGITEIQALKNALGENCEQYGVKVSEFSKATAGALVALFSIDYATRKFLFGAGEIPDQTPEGIRRAIDGLKNSSNGTAIEHAIKLAYGSSMGALKKTLEGAGIGVASDADWAKMDVVDRYCACAGALASNEAKNAVSFSSDLYAGALENNIEATRLLVGMDESARDGVVSYDESAIKIVPGTASVLSKFIAPFDSFSIISGLGILSEGKPFALLKSQGAEVTQEATELFVALQADYASLSTLMKETRDTYQADPLAVNESDFNKLYSELVAAMKDGLEKLAEEMPQTGVDWGRERLEAAISEFEGLLATHSDGKTLAYHAAVQTQLEGMEDQPSDLFADAAANFGEALSDLSASINTSNAAYDAFKRLAGYNEPFSAFQIMRRKELFENVFPNQNIDELRARQRIFNEILSSAAEVYRKNTAEILTGGQVKRYDRFNGFLDKISGANFAPGLNLYGTSYSNRDGNMVVLPPSMVMQMDRAAQQITSMDQVLRSYLLATPTFGQFTQINAPTDIASSIYQSTIFGEMASSQAAWRAYLGSRSPGVGVGQYNVGSLLPPKAPDFTMALAQIERIADEFRDRNAVITAPSSVDFTGVAARETAREEKTAGSARVEAGKGQAGVFYEHRKPGKFEEGKETHANFDLNDLQGYGVLCDIATADWRENGIQRKYPLEPWDAVREKLFGAGGAEEEAPGSIGYRIRKATTMEELETIMNDLQTQMSALEKGSARSWAAGLADWFFENKKKNDPPLTVEKVQTHYAETYSMAELTEKMTHWTDNELSVSVGNVLYGEGWYEPNNIAERIKAATTPEELLVIAAELREFIGTEATKEEAFDTANHYAWEWLDYLVKKIEMEQNSTTFVADIQKYFEDYYSAEVLNEKQDTQPGGGSYRVLSNDMRATIEASPYAGSNVIVELRHNSDKAETQAPPYDRKPGQKNESSRDFTDLHVYIRVDGNNWVEYDLTEDARNRMREKGGDFLYKVNQSMNNQLYQAGTTGYAVEAQGAVQRLKQESVNLNMNQSIGTEGLKLVSAFAEKNGKDVSAISGNSTWNDVKSALEEKWKDFSDSELDREVVDYGVFLGFAVPSLLPGLEVVAGKSVTGEQKHGAGYVGDAVEAKLSYYKIASSRLSTFAGAQAFSSAGSGSPRLNSNFEFLQKDEKTESLEADVSKKGVAKELDILRLGLLFPIGNADKKIYGGIAGYQSDEYASGRGYVVKSYGFFGMDRYETEGDRGMKLNTALIGLEGQTKNKLLWWEMPSTLIAQARKYPYSEDMWRYSVTEKTKAGKYNFEVTASVSDPAIYRHAGRIIDAPDLLRNISAAAATLQSAYDSGDEARKNQALESISLLMEQVFVQSGGYDILRELGTNVGEVSMRVSSDDGAPGMILNFSHLIRDKDKIDRYATFININSNFMFTGTYEDKLGKKDSKKGQNIGGAYRSTSGKFKVSALASMGGGFMAQAAGKAKVFGEEMEAGALASKSGDLMRTQFFVSPTRTLNFNIAFSELERKEGTSGDRFSTQRLKSTYYLNESKMRLGLALGMSEYRKMVDNDWKTPVYKKNMEFSLGSFGSVLRNADTEFVARYEYIKQKGTANKRDWYIGMNVHYAF